MLSYENQFFACARNIETKRAPTDGTICMTEYFLYLVLVADQFTLSKNEGGTESVLHQLINNFLSLTNELRKALKEKLFFFRNIS